MSSLLRSIRFGRRPISRRRRWVGLAGLLAMLGVIVGYHILTRPERVRAFAEVYLQDMTGGLVRIQAARFNLFEGLHLTDVRVAAHPDPAFDPGRSSVDDRIIFRSQDLYLKLRPFSLITGDLVVPEIIAFEPTLRLLKDPESGSRNWQYLLGKRKPPRRPVEKSPTIRLRSAIVDLEWTRPSRGRTTSHLALDVTATGTSGSLYDVRWRTRMDPIENGRFVLDMSTLQLRTAEGGLPTIPVASVRWAAPVELERWLELLDLRGQVRTDSLSYDPARGSSARITLHDASLAVPANEQDRSTPRNQRYLAFTGVQGQLVFQGSAVEISLTGQWREGTCALKGRIFADAATMRGFDDLGFDIAIEGRHILLPAPAAKRSAAEARFIEQWPKFVDFCDFYSPEGHVDLAFSLGKRPGREHPLEFRGGTLVPLGASTRFIAFPYRLDGLTGTVRFEPDGQVRLEKLVGRHGPATIRVDGLMTSPTWACGVDLAIEGLGVELDESLHGCLSTNYRSVWETFDPKGCANVHVAMHREPGIEKNTRPWDTTVLADLLGISACYERLPLTMADVRGRIQITPDEFFVDDVRGRYRGATWSIDGIVATPQDQPPQVSLRIRARELPIDDELARALPETGGRLLGTLHPQGSADIAGTASTGTDGDLDYDLTAHLALSSVCPEPAPLELTNLGADVHVLARQIEVEQLAARYGSGSITLQGVIPLTDEAEPMWLTATAQGVSLTPELFTVLPRTAQQVWDALRPKGRIDADAELCQRAAGDWDQIDAEVEIRPQGVSISPTAFPLNVSDVTGTFRATSEGIEILDAAGQLGDGRLSLDGRIHRTANALGGDLQVRAMGMEFGDAIRRALPWRARRAWDAVKPAGKFDLSLRRLTFAQAADAGLNWTYDGRIDLHGVDLAAGALRGLEGTIAAEGTLASGGTDIGIDGSMDLKQLRFGKRVATDLRGTLTKKPEEAVLRLGDLRADLYEGLASGFAELRFNPDRTTYGVSAVVRDMSLLAFLEAGRSEKAKPIEAQGIVEGTLFVNGALGEKQSREGGGTFHIEHAQIMKIPLLLAIVGALNFAPPDENAFHDGTADFTLQGDALTLSPIDLRGNSISLVGGGRMDTATQQLDLTLLAGSPHRLPRLGLLTELAEGAARELMEVRVRGSLYEPRIEAQPLRSLRETMEALGELKKKPHNERALRP
jgi:hypothetical protein